MRRFGRGRGAQRRQVFVFGLDGTPYSWLRAETAAGRLPNLAALFRSSSVVPMRSSLPSVSSTAWTTFLTGRDPGGHGLFGFMDCRPMSHEFYFPNLQHVTVPTIWDALGSRGKRSVLLNVPGTYPARPIPGVLVSGFVAPSLDRSVHPPRLLARLKAMGYRIDLDNWAARGGFEALETDLFATFERRVEATRMLLAEEPWDLFVTVLTETDRLYHFLWNAMAAGDERAVELFHRFHARVDEFAGWLFDALPDGTELIALSDHGFAAERTDVFTNAWLRERGYLAFDTSEPKGLAEISPGSTVYSLDPGRFYVNRSGRRPRGSVPPERAGEVVERLVCDLADLRDPATGELAYGRLLRREDAYHGRFAPAGPDVVLTLRPGYELKGSSAARSVFGPPGDGLGGMHAADDAFLCVRGATLRDGPYDLHDLAPTILELLGVEPEGLQGRSVLAPAAAGATVGAVEVGR
ncbi:MAG TPA: alkaline phosphatase family protein [Actinomycetota bacterium]|nr:alkaline phosphatase family protein [Actinomycetota bacterium]